MSNKSEFFFRGSGSVLYPNHITRYSYPCLLGYPKSCLRLQPPANSTKRSRPQGSFSWGQDGHTFLTITRSGRPPPTQAQFDAWVVAEKENDKESKNAVGRVMRRVTAYQGNTLLESGKFKLRREDGLVYVIKRTTVVVLGGEDKGKYGRDEDTYIIPVENWRGLRPEMEKGREHDGWWMRLHDLYQGKFDRAFWSAVGNLDALGIPMPLTKWRRRPDVEALVKVYDKGPLPGQQEKKEKGEEDKECGICGNEWFAVSEFACRLKCGHYVCLQCMTEHLDNRTGRGNLNAKEHDPGGKFCRCPLCKDINAVKIDRTSIIAPDEFDFWRWKICMRRLEKEVKDYWLLRLLRLQAMAMDRWCGEIPESLDHNKVHEWVRTYVRYNDAVRFMEGVPKFVWSLLPFGFSLDNPVYSKEGAALENALRTELASLAKQKQKVFNTEQLIKQLKEVGKNAFTPVVVQDVAARLGNPQYPPGYTTYRDFLCEWTARGCFMSPMGRVEIEGFVKRMREEKRPWWKDERDVFFDP